MKIVDTIKTGGESRADELGYDPRNRSSPLPTMPTSRRSSPSSRQAGPQDSRQLVMEHSPRHETDAYNPAERAVYTDVPELDKDKTKGGLLVTDPRPQGREIIPVG